ncbi:hypothetical protein L1887_35351 [Cichorium endivia]|nr:hypothetical protein L1887_35351 [Cichorium endivia]
MHRLNGGARKFKKSLLGSTFVLISVCGTKRKLLKVKSSHLYFLISVLFNGSKTPCGQHLMHRNFKSLKISHILTLIFNYPIRFHPLLSTFFL